MRTNRFTLLFALLFAAGCGGQDFNDESPGNAPTSPGAGGSSGSEPGIDAGTPSPDSGEQDAGIAGQAGAGDAGSEESTGDAGPVGAGGSAGTSGASGTAGSAGAEQDAGFPDVDVPDVDPSCPPGWGDCDGVASNGCEASLDLVEHCGGCGHACTAGPHASVACESGACVPACEAGFEDCDGNPANGCEADTSSIDHCGACGNACNSAANASSVCQPSGCGYVCTASFGDCDLDAANGCETNLNTTVAHCGSCGAACPDRPQATAICDSAQCGFACIGTFADCDGTVGNGCEVNLSGDVSNCGACGQTCGTANGTPTCTSGACAITCLAGWGDCDQLNQNGCEGHTDADPVNCGACGNVCGSANGTPFCTSGSCGLVCHGEFANCDGDHVNGCEIDLDTDPDNCGACGRSCLGAQCSNGLCVPKPVATASRFTISEGFLYAVDPAKTKITRIPTFGGLSSTLVQNQSQIGALLVADGRVYYGSGISDAKILSVNATPGAPWPYPVVDTEHLSTAPVFLAHTPGTLYWIASGNIWQHDIGSSLPPASLAPAASDAREIYRHNHYVYWNEPNENRLKRASIVNGNVTEYPSNLNRPADLAVKGAVYWVNEGDGTIWTMDVFGNPPDLLVSGQNHPYSIAVDDQIVWLTDAGEVWRAELDGTDPTRLAEGQSGAQDVALYGEYVYWRNPQTNKVMRVAL